MVYSSLLTSPSKRAPSRPLTEATYQKLSFAPKVGKSSRANTFRKWKCLSLSWFHWFHHLPLQLANHYSTSLASHSDLQQTALPKPLGSAFYCLSQPKKPKNTPTSLKIDPKPQRGLALQNPRNKKKHSLFSLHEAFFPAATLCLQLRDLRQGRQRRRLLRHQRRRRRRRRRRRPRSRGGLEAFRMVFLGGLWGGSDAGIPGGFREFMKKWRVFLKF